MSALINVKVSEAYAAIGLVKTCTNSNLDFFEIGWDNIDVNLLKLGIYEQIEGSINMSVFIVINGRHNKCNKRLKFYWYDLKMRILKLYMGYVITNA